jgi:hypothetical protein
MLRFSRLLATRLRRAAFPAPRPPVHATSLDRWARLASALEATDERATVVRERELAQENLRLAITLIGQQGRAAFARVLAACNGEVAEATLPVRVALEVARGLGHVP